MRVLQSGIEGREVTVLGAGVLGLWQALLLARAGARVRLFDRNADPLSESASSYAGAMLAPDCESEAAPPIVRDLGRQGFELWRYVYPGVKFSGSLVVASPRDTSELMRFARMTERYEKLDEAQVGELEPDLAGRFSSALYFAEEGHVETPAALAFLLDEVRRLDVEIVFGAAGAARPEDITADQTIVDCRGLAARDALPTLRGVRGERLIIRCTDVRLSRPVRLLHPRHPLYVVPWSDHRFMVGATVLESEDSGPVTVRSTLELLGAAYSLSPSFGEAEILDIGAGVRPAFPDNVPGINVSPDLRVVHVNGAYRHGFLLAPVLAEAVLSLLSESGCVHPLVHRNQRA
ncbi:FAD-dependent oxidoreductase [Filomicrobium sp.]|uniref:FAD-dependent oxidoreductase n=1 Tax=Filomicrobium sp. TaxID=2024831 RepID=UPI00258F2822|nr:FAD-dependent oxidoreductase [Filomicrobium sp.]